MGLTKLLAVVLAWGLRRGLTIEQITTAQSLAWYFQRTYTGPPLPPSHWAQLSVRAVLNGRDLPGCGTSVHDALHVAWQGHGMGEVVDSSPGPDRLTSHREMLEKILSELSDLKREIAELRLQGVANREIAAQVGLSPGRVSQIAKEIVEKFRNG